MKYSLVLTKDEIGLLKDELNSIMENSCFLAKVVTAKSILEQIKKVENITKFDKEEQCNDDNCYFTNCNGCNLKDNELVSQFVSENQCFNEGLNGNCGYECKYFKFDGCSYKDK